MQKVDDYFTEIIDITLYKYNSIDLKLWGILQRDSEVKKSNEETVIVSKKRMLQYLELGFKKDVNRFHAVSGINIHKEATSVYFIWQIFETMPNLKYIKVNLNKNSSYNRIVTVDQAKTIKYDIKTLRGSIRMFDLFNMHEIHLSNSILVRAGLLNEGDNFKIFRVK